jgi:hypothetical protein
MGCDGDPAISSLYGAYARGEISLDRLREIEAEMGPPCRHDLTRRLGDDENQPQQQEEAS